MRTKLSGKYVKFVAVLAIVGFVGFLAYLMITCKFSENTAVTRYTMPVKRESQSNVEVPIGRSRNERALTVESTKSITFETPKVPPHQKHSQQKRILTQGMQKM